MGSRVIANTRHGLTRGDIGKNERTYLIAIVAGDDGILDEGRTRRNERDTQGACVYPSTGCQFKVLGDPAIKDNTLRWVINIRKTARIANAVKPFIVERFPSLNVILPIAGRDVWTFDPQL